MNRRRQTDARGFGLSDEELRHLGFEVGAVGGVRPPKSGAVPAEREAPHRSWRPSAGALGWCSTLAVLVAGAWAGSGHRALPDAESAGAPDTAFASARAMGQLVEIAARAGAPGSPGHDRVSAYLADRLRGLGLETDVQIALHAEAEGTRVRAATLRNVVARLPGAASTGLVALVARYDATPGAGDDAMGVATVLEAVRTVTARGGLRNDLLILLADGEGIGVSGVRAFATADARAADVGVVISVDLGGAEGPVVASASGPLEGALVRALAGGRARPVATRLLPELDPGRSRLARPFVERGASAVALTTLRPTERPHTPPGARDGAGEATLQHAGLQVMALLEGVGAADLDGTGEGAAARASADGVEYVSSPLVGVVDYPAGWIALGTLGLVLVWGSAGLLLRWRHGSIKAVLASVLLAAAVVGATGWLSARLVETLAAAHPEFGRFQSAFYREGRHVLALAALALAVVSSALAASRRRLRLDELLVGAATLPLGVCIWLTWRSPAAATALQWPLAAGLWTALLVVGVGPGRRRTRWMWALSTVLGGLALLAAVPAIELATSVWTLRAATRIGWLLALVLLLILPALDWLTRPRAWWTPALGLGVAALLVTASLPSVQGGAAHPVPTSLLYLADQPVRARLRLPGDDLAESDSSRVRRMDGRWLTLPGPAEWWARSWVPAPAEPGSEPGVLLLADDGRWEVTGVAPETELAPPRASLVGVVPDGAGGTVTLSVRTGLRGEMLGVHLPDGIQGEWTGIGPVRWTAASVRSLVHWGRPQSTAERAPDGAASAVSELEAPAPEGGDREWPPLELELRLDDVPAVLDVDVVEHLLRPREILGEAYFVRPDSIVADAPTGTDRVIQRTRLRIPLGPVRPRGRR